MKTLFKFIFLIVAILVVLSFVGVQPLSAYKDTIVSKVKQSIASYVLLPIADTVNSHQFDVEIISVEFERATSSLANLFDPTLRLQSPGRSLPVKVSITPKSSFTGEPFEVVVVNGEEITQSRPIVYLVLYDKDGYCFGWQGPINWTPSELRPPDESVRNYDYLQAMIGQRTKTVTFFVDGSDKAVVALRSELEKVLTKMGEDAWRSFFSGDWLVKSGGDYDEQVESVNKELLRIVGKYFKVEVVGKQRITELSEKKYQDLKKRALEND